MNYPNIPWICVHMRSLNDKNKYYIIIKQHQFEFLRLNEMADTYIHTHTYTVHTYGKQCIATAFRENTQTSDGYICDQIFIETFNRGCFDKKKFERVLVSPFLFNGS